MCSIWGKHILCPDRKDVNVSEGTFGNESFSRCMLFYLENDYLCHKSIYAYDDVPKFFNTAGPIKQEIHYNVDPLSRIDLEEIELLIQ